MRALLGALVCLFLLTACAGRLAPAVEIIGDEADDALQLTEQTFCRAPTIGSISREYSDEPERWRARNEVCAPHTPPLPGTVDLRDAPPRPPPDLEVPP